MNLLTLSEVLAIAGPERDRLREADDAIRDILALVDEQAVEAGLDGALMSAAMVDLLLVAAAKLALAQRPKSEISALSEDFEDLARQAFDWVGARAAPNLLNRPPAPRRRP
jgi:hypothetical protein